MTDLALQPKRLALLIYLALAEPNRLRRRDVLAALFWPDLNADHARAALSESLRYLRRTLGDEALVNRGAEEVGISRAALWCDALAFQEACQANRAGPALDLYRGPFLDGFFIGQAAAELDDWVTDTRNRLATEASRMAWLESRRSEIDSDSAKAIRLGRWALEQRPMDEGSVRQLIELHDRLGDRTGALSVYEAWVRQVQEAFGSSPSPETVALIEAVKARTRPHVGLAGTGPPADLSVPNGTIPKAGAATRPRWSVAGKVVAALAVVAAITWVWITSRGEMAQSVAPGTTLAILPLENATGDTTLDYLAFGLGESIRKLFGRETRLHVTPGGIVAAIRATPVPAAEAGAKLGVAFVLDWQLMMHHDSLVLQADLFRVAGGARVVSTAYPVELRSALGLEHQIVRDIAATIGVSAASLDATSLPAEHSAAAHLLQLGARWQMGRRSNEAMRIARDLSLRAIELEPLDPEGYVSLGIAYNGMAHYGVVAPDVGFPRAEAAAREALKLDPSSQRAHGIIANVLASYRWNWPAADSAFRLAIAGDPDAPEIRNSYGIMLRNTERFDEAIAQFREAARLEPLSRHYRRQVGTALHCAGRVAEAVAEYRAAIEIDPRYSDGWTYLSVALANLGRHDEAIEANRTAARLAGDSATLAAFANRRGRDGYLAARRAIARATLDTLRALARQGQFVSDAEFAEAFQVLGDFDEAYRRFARAVERRDVRALTVFCPVDDAPHWPADARLAAIRRAMGLP